MTGAAPKRFYQSARVEERGGRFEIRLDGKPAKTRGGEALAAPTRAMAEAIADEWNAQGERVDPATMPLTRLAATAIDRGDKDPGAWREAILSFLRSDLLCYRASEPTALRALQNDIWDPLLVWAAGRGIALKTGQGVAFIEQPPASLTAAERALAATPPAEVLAMKLAAEITGSAVIAMALAAHAFPAEVLFAASRVDEAFQAQRWGGDAEAERRAERLRNDFLMVARFLALLKP